nr:MAG TPA: KilAC domain protein [Caudoviricetes sp.]
MNEMKVFENSDFGQIRTAIQGNEPWFVAADVCRPLEHSNVSMALDRLDDDEKAKLNLGLPGGDTNCVNEAGLYALVLGSRKPEAKAFKRWITHEVIPEIRRHGAYLTDEATEAFFSNPDTFARLAVKWRDERHARLAAEEQAREKQKKIEADAPKVLFADSVAASRSEILVGELAKLLRQNGVPVGQNRLFQRMREDGFLINRRGTDYNTPTQKSMEMGLMCIKETAITHADGHVTVNRTPKITGKGQVYFINRYRA